jgi:transposase InsO family protein
MLHSSSFEAISQLQPPTSLSTLQKFLGFINHFRRYTPVNFSNYLEPLTRLTKKDVPFRWGPDQQTAFDDIKAQLLSAQILRPPDLTRPFVVYSDASNFAAGGALFQAGEDGFLHPVEYYSSKFDKVELNYTGGDKEMLAVMQNLGHWRHLLSSTGIRVEVRTDHSNLVPFPRHRLLTSRHIRWATELAEYDVVIVYVPKSQNVIADAFSRRADLRMTPAEDRERREFILLPPSILQPASPPIPVLAAALKTRSRRGATRRVEAVGKGQVASADDAEDGGVGRVAVESEVEGGEEGAGVATGTTGLREVVTDPARRLDILRARHDAPFAGHRGGKGTYRAVARDFYWPGCRKDCEEWARSCVICQRSKPSRQRPAGLLQPLQPPSGPGKRISLDLIVGLPESNGYNAILTIVDHFTKRVTFVACRDTITSSEIEKVITHEIIRVQGIPEEVLSDRGPQFRSKHWFSFFESLGCRVLLSTAFHPQTDGLTERMNQTVELYLRQYVAYDQADWADRLDAAEISINNADTDSTGRSPYFHDLGRNPRFDFVALPEGGKGRVEEAVSRAVGLGELWRDLAGRYAVAQKRMKEQADKKRRDLEFKVGDKVWVERKNMSTGRPSEKLDMRRIGPYKVTARVGPVAYRVALPPDVRVHPVFHVSFLSPFHENTFQGRQPPPPPPDIIEGQEEWEVEAVMDSRKKPGRGRRYEWLIKWKGYGLEEMSWEPWENVRNAENLVKAFHKSYPGIPAPERYQQGPAGVGKMVKRRRKT